MAHIPVFYIIHELSDAVVIVEVKIGNFYCDIQNYNFSKLMRCNISRYFKKKLMSKGEKRQCPLTLIY